MRRFLNAATFNTAAQPTTMALVAPAPGASAFVAFPSAARPLRSELLGPSVRGEAASLFAKWLPQ